VPVDEGTEDQEVFVFLLEFDQVPCVVPLLKPWPRSFSQVGLSPGCGPEWALAHGRWVVDVHVGPLDVGVSLRSSRRSQA
jgi:hypothetical protein